MLCTEKLVRVGLCSPRQLACDEALSFTAETCDPMLRTPSRPGGDDVPCTGKLLKAVLCASRRSSCDGALSFTTACCDPMLCTPSRPGGDNVLCTGLLLKVVLCDPRRATSAPGGSAVGGRAVCFFRRILSLSAKASRSSL